MRQVYMYDLDTKQQSSPWKSPSSPHPKKARQVHSNVKSMVILVFNINRVVHHESGAQGYTVNHHFYIGVL
jgi:hypothetical protein